MPFARIANCRHVWRLKDALLCGGRLSTLSSNQLASSSSLVQRRPFTIDTIPPPTFEGEAKRYAPKIEKIVTDISQLTLLEVADLNELLKKTLNIPDAPAMMFSSAAGQAAAKPAEEEEVEAAPVKAEKTLFTVRLMKYDDTKKVAVIKEIKNLVAGMNLVQAKKFVESVPQTVKADISKEEADKLKATLEAVGGLIEID